MSIASIQADYAFNNYYQSYSNRIDNADVDEQDQGKEIGRVKTQETQKSDKEHEFTESELEQIRALKARDLEVRQHEAAHQAAGGAHTGSATYTYERGPDGKMYAVGGEVSVDTSVISGDPQATVQKMRSIYAAAMAPKDPSGQDRQVAAQAMAQMIQAQLELLSEMSSTETKGGTADTDIDVNTAA